MHSLYYICEQVTGVDSRYLIELEVGCRDSSKCVQTLNICLIVKLAQVFIKIIKKYTSANASILYNDSTPSGIWHHHLSYSPFLMKPNLFSSACHDHTNFKNIPILSLVSCMYYMPVSKFLPQECSKFLW